MLDVSFLFDDPDFCSDCQLIRRRYKDQAIVEDVAIIKAVIQPAAAEDIGQLQAQSAFGFLGEVKAIYSSTTLSVGSDASLCDRIRFNGRLYDVTSVSDFAPNGNYCHALLVRVTDE